MDESDNKVVFYYNKKFIYIKTFILWIVFGLCIFITVTFDSANIYGFIIAELGKASCIYSLFVWSYACTGIILEIYPEYVTCYRVFRKIDTQIDIYWEDIIEIKEITGILNNKICIVYKDDFENKVRKEKIKIKYSKCTYEKIYNTLIKKLDEYRISNK